MSFSISASNSSVALSLLSGITGSSGSPDLVSIANGLGGTGSTVDPVSALTQAETNETKDVAIQAQQPTTKAEINRFLAVVGKASTLQDIMKDPTARKVFLSANGLGDQVDYTALATKALLSKPTDKTSLAATLSNTAWLSAVTTFDFADKGLSVLKTPKVLTTITNGYAQYVWSRQQDQNTPGLSAALDFRSRAHTVTTVDGILGDANIRAVVTGALGIPQQIAFQPIPTQEKAISDKLDVKKLQDPKFVEQLAREYLIQNQASLAGSATSPITSLLA